MAEYEPTHFEAPEQNFSEGLRYAQMPDWMGPVSRGKVRDSWVIDQANKSLRVLVTTDRQSAYDSVVGTIPGKGQVLNLLSAFWFANLRDIAPSHMIDIPHPNVLIAEQAVATLPVEFVVRGYMAKSSTTTSVYRQYLVEGKREIYGITFPEGIGVNEKLPMGPILTPTTKAEGGAHDDILTNEKAEEMIDREFGYGTYKRGKEIVMTAFEKGTEISLKHDLIPADTKFELGFNRKRDLMFIDEVLTPDSSRWWRASTYEARLKNGQDPEIFDKEILRKWLAEHGFTGELGQTIPVLESELVRSMADAYLAPFKMLTNFDVIKASTEPGYVGSIVGRKVKELLST